MARLARGHREVLPAQICFHAQQAAEKALKDVLTFHGIEFPPVHVIRTLVEITEASGLDVPSEVADAGSQG
jgi:HEPN domain-containing protein